MPLTPRGQQVYALIQDIVKGTVSPNQSIVMDPKTFVVPTQTNSILFNSPSGPVTVANVDSVQSLAVTVLGINARSGGNIQGFFGGGVSMAGPFWKFSAILSAGDRSKSTSVVWSGGSDAAAAKAAALSWAQALALTLGNDGAAGAALLAPSAASPRVKFIRISDAINPRFGFLVRTDPTSANFSGPGTGAGQNGFADFISTALAVRLMGDVTVPTAQTGYANHALIGIPDKVVTEGDQYDPTALVGPAGNMYGATVVQYMNYLLSAGNALGFLISNQPTFACTTFTFNGTLWQFMAPGNTLATGDKIRLTKCNAPGFNGTYIVQVFPATPGLVAINSGPPANVAAPTKGTLRAIQTQAGVKLAAWSQFKQLPGIGIGSNLVVSKRNPARLFTGVSFRRKARRLH